MKNVGSFWLPDGDTYFVDKPNYEIEDTNRAFKKLKKCRVAIDVGAHCGYWSQRLSKKFEQVISLEPVTEHFECLKKNTHNVNNIEVIKAAASDTNTLTKIKIYVENSGKSKISEHGTPINSITLDSLALKNVDFIKIDVEGHEKNVLIGAHETIMKYKPVLFVEIHEDYAAIEKILKSMGYSETDKINNNYIWETSSI